MNPLPRTQALLLVALLLISACERYDPSRDQALRETLATMRAALEKFRSSEGRYPHSLEELVPKVLPQIPVDPLTGSATTWRLTTEETVRASSDFALDTGAVEQPVVIGINSGAPGADRNGTLYSNY